MLLCIVVSTFFRQHTNAIVVNNLLKRTNPKLSNIYPSTKRFYFIKVRKGLYDTSVTSVHSSGSSWRNSQPLVQCWVPSEGSSGFTKSSQDAKRGLPSTNTTGRGGRRELLSTGARQRCGGVLAHDRKSWSLKVMGSWMQHSRKADSSCHLPHSITSREKKLWDYWWNAESHWGSSREFFLYYLYV